jgi:hypothetical protein
MARDRIKSKPTFIKLIKKGLAFDKKIDIKTKPKGGILHDSEPSSI